MTFCSNHLLENELKKPFFIYFLSIAPLCSVEVPPPPAAVARRKQVYRPRTRVRSCPQVGEKFKTWDGVEVRLIACIPSVSWVETAQISEIKRESSCFQILEDALVEQPCFISRDIVTKNV